MGDLLQPGTAAPDFTVEDESGKRWTLSDLRGKPVLVNFYKSTCAYCTDEIPRLAKVFNEATEYQHSASSGQRGPRPL